MKYRQRVVVTGLGVVAPGAKNTAQFLKVLQSGNSPIEQVLESEEKGLGCCVGGIAEFDREILGEYYDYFGFEKASSFVQLACAAGLEAWKNAHLPIPEFKSNTVDYDTGIIIGAGLGAVDFVASRVAPAVDSGRNIKMGSSAVAMTMLSGPAAFLSAMLATGNVHYGNSNACCTGTDAILEGYHKIKLGTAKRMLVGGVEGYSPYLWAMFDTMRALNRKHNDSPQKASRPMSETARGFVPSSGAGVLMLESLESALARDAPIYAELLGGHANCGGQRNGGSMTFPNSEAVIRCIEKALEVSDIRNHQIDLISGHLTATKADPLEVANWRKVFDEKFPMINSPKSIFGHCLGGAGGVESVAVALQLHHGFIHPSINCEDVHPEIESLIPVSSIPMNKIEKTDLKYTIKASFGFGDVNTCLVFKKWD